MWTSPIWYQPDGIARVHARIRHGTRPATDRLVMRVLLGRKAGDFDPTRHDIVVRVSDDDDILAVTIPARALSPAGLKRFVLRARVARSGAGAAATARGPCCRRRETRRGVDRGARRTPGRCSEAAPRRRGDRRGGALPRGPRA